MELMLRSIRYRLQLALPDGAKYQGQYAQGQKKLDAAEKLVIAIANI